jgi:hypothetical protein
VIGRARIPSIEGKEKTKPKKKTKKTKNNLGLAKVGLFFLHTSLRLLLGRSRVDSLRCGDKDDGSVMHLYFY